MDIEKKVKGVPGSASKCKKGLSKLADLAQTINQWEDDIHTVSTFQVKIICNIIAKLFYFLRKYIQFF